MRTHNIESRAFLLLVLITTAAFIWIVRDFLMPVFWAIVLAVLFRPMHRHSLRLVRGRASAAAVVTTLAVVIVIVVPFGLLAAAVTQQALGLIRRIQSGDIDVQAPIEYIERSIPAAADLLSAYGLDVASIRQGVEQAALSASQFIATQALGFGRDAITFTIFFGLTLYFLFFFIRDWEKILEGIVRALPLGDARERRLFDKFAEVSRATMKGTVVVAVVQGTIGGILFAAIGIDAAIFWGVAMGIFSLLPAIGPPIIWIPAAIILFATGAIWEAIVVVIVGSLIIGLVDNLLRPILVGRDTKMPDYLVLLSTLGGLAVFGLAGVVAGPLVAALFLVVWEMMAVEYSERQAAT